MDIHGVVTRLVAADPQTGKRAQVFFRPSDPAVLRQLDGRQYVASGEIPVAVEDLDGYALGDEGDFSVT